MCIFKIFIFFLLTFYPIAAFSADINIDTTSSFVYPEYSKKISMDFQDANLVDVLKIFSQQTSLNLVTAENIAAKKITVYLDNVPVEKALEQVLRANNLTYELQPESNIYIVKQFTQPDAELITRVYPLKYATVGTSKLKATLKIKVEEDEIETKEDEGSGIKGALQNIITEKGRITEDPRSNSFIITDIASNFSNIESVLSRLDVPQVQILIEVEMLEVAENTAELIGIKTGDTPLQFTGAQRDVLYPWDQNRLISSNRGAEFITEFLNNEYTVGTLDASGLTATLQLLRTHSDTRSLARPRILTLNNETAQIKITTDEAIGTVTQASDAGAGGGLTSVEAERVETGVILTVTPQANIVNQEIIMAIAPKVVIARSGAVFEGRQFKDPEERGSQSILKIKSGDTIILGGLIREDTTETHTKVPILGDIPLIGAAFRHKDESQSERELIIFITPHIVNEPSLPRTASANPHTLIREQDLPKQKLDDIQKELSIAEKQKL